MTSASPPTLASCLKAAVAGGAVAAGINLLLALAAPRLGIPMVAQFDPSAAPMQLPAVMAVIASLVPALGAAFAYFGIARLTASAPRVFTVVAVLLLVGSMGGPLTLAAAAPSTKAVLALMHVVAGVAIVRPLLRVRS